MSPLLILGLIGLPVLLCLIALVVSHNRFAAQVALVEESWSQVDVELQRRHDLVPNLVRTVQAYAEHESSVLGRVTEARAAAAAHRGEPPAGRRPFEEEVGGALRQVVAVAESYPDLKASAAFVHLQQELTHTEDRIAAGRRFYNGNVRALNTRVRTFPSGVVASMFGFGAREYFELTDPREAQTPAVEP